MIFKNAMSFKAKIKQLAKEKGLTTAQIQQNYLIEIFLTQLAKSEYCDNFIVKGGYLIGSLIGIDLRTTMDLDATLRGIELTAMNLEKIVKEIIKIESDSSFTLFYDSITEIREINEYPGFRVKLNARYERISEVILIDVTTGDIITPKEMSFNFKKMFQECELNLLTYPIETVLSEKLQTILSRGVASTRPRDFYDVYILSKLKAEEIDYPTLKLSIDNTFEKRQTKIDNEEINLVLNEIVESEFQEQLWKKYQTQYPYAKETSFNEVVNSVKLLMERVSMS